MLGFLLGAGRRFRPDAFGEIEVGPSNGEGFAAACAGQQNILDEIGGLLVRVLDQCGCQPRQLIALQIARAPFFLLRSTPFAGLSVRICQRIARANIFAAPQSRGLRHIAWC